MAQFEYWMTTDLKRGSSQVQVLHGQTFTQDNLGNRVGVVVKDGNAPATLSGTVTGYVIRADGGTVVVAGAVDGNKAYIDLPESAYAVPGQIQIAIRLVEATGSQARFSADVQSETITDVEIDAETFIAKESMTGVPTRQFEYKSYGWTISTGTVVALNEYGITIVGTPTVGDKIIITDSAAKTVLGAVTAYVQRTATGTIIDPGHVIPDIDDIIARMDEMEQAVQAERIREANERRRKEDERTRQNNEHQRNENEYSRMDAETARNQSELTRRSNETARETAESGRVTAEGLRVQAEDSRVTAEGLRVQAENGRASAEQGRVTAEAARETAEDEREEGYSTIEQNAQAALSYIGPSESSSTASAAHAKGSYLIYDGKLYQATADIAIGDTLAATGEGANIAQTPGGAMGEVADLKSKTAALEELAIINNSGIGIAGASNLVYSGFGPRALPVGKALTTDKETSISASVGNVGGISPGITAATVDEGIFVDKIGHSDAAAYSFVYEIDRWMFGGASVTLTDYGITVAGTAINGDEIVVHVAAATIPMNVMDHDYHTPVNANIPHTCTIAMRDCYENRQFDAPEGLIHVVNGLAAGSHYCLTLYKGAYGGGTAQDGVYGGTLGADQAIPAGGYLRHTTMGVYQSGGYTREQIANGKWIAYDASFVQIGAQIATDVDDTSGTNFGTSTASTYQGNSEHVNFTERNAYGCNRVDQSAWLQYANAEGLGWWQQKNEWDFPPANVATIKGLMTGLDHAMKAAMVPVRIRTALANCDGGGYVDIETKVFPLSMTEVGFGANNGQYETSWGLNDTLKTVPLAFWQGATNEDRIKTLNGAARYWFLRGAYPSFAHDVRGVNTSGALSYDYASNAHGLVAAWVIGNPVIQPA